MISFSLIYGFCCSQSSVDPTFSPDASPFCHGDGDVAFVSFPPTVCLWNARSSSSVSFPIAIDANHTIVGNPDPESVAS